MYIDMDLIIKVAAFITALISLGGVIIAIYKVFENNRKQNEVIRQIHAEQRIICEGVKGALQGLIEQGCDGPCKEALKNLDEHLNRNAHEPDL